MSLSIFSNDDFAGFTERPQQGALSAEHRVIGEQHRTLRAEQGAIKFGEERQVSNTEQSGLGAKR